MSSEDKRDADTDVLADITKSIEAIERTRKRSWLSHFVILVSLAALISAFGVFYLSAQVKRSEIEKAELALARIEDNMQLLIDGFQLESEAAQSKEILKDVGELAADVKKTAHAQGMSLEQIDRHGVLHLAEAVANYRKAFFQGNRALYDQAVVDLKNVSDTSRGREAKYYTLTAAYSRLGEVTKQADYYRLADAAATKLLEIEKEKKQKTSRRNLNVVANIKLNGGDPKGALDIYDQLTKEDPTNPVFLFNRAAAQTKLGRLSDALESLEELVRLQARVRAVRGAITQHDLLADPDLQALRDTTDPALRRRFQGLVVQLPQSSGP